MNTNDAPKPKAPVAAQPSKERERPDVNPRLAFARDLGELLAEIFLRGS